MTALVLQPQVLHQYIIIATLADEPKQIRNTNRNTYMGNFWFVIN